MMRLRKKDQFGFTLMEMMIALVVGGMLMASLVGISASVQRTFGRSAEVTELQANLRFSMKTMVQDISRAAFMYSPDVNKDLCHLSGAAIPGAQEAIAFATDTSTFINLTLRGNFASSRDYLLDLKQMPYKVVCRNKQNFIDFGRCSQDQNSADVTTHESYLEPFGDGPGITDVFPLNSWVRLDVDNRRYAYYLVNSVNEGDLSIDFTNAVDRNEIRGDYRWISPISTLRWRMQQTAETQYKPRFGVFSEANSRWVLMRQFLDTAGAVNREVEVAEFLLSPNMGGLEFQVVNDNTASMCMQAAVPSLQVPTAITAAVDPVQTRAVIVTIRGRTESEDPGFFIDGYDHPPLLGNINQAIDLDNNPTNGLAMVIMERTVINLRNLSLNQSF